ncbi:MAG: hypothetical protein OIF50_10365 [Flavobacteriaceae bacterium]|nr:hypothetical protein [Flavobacteriaceae bacterium]
MAPGASKEMYWRFFTRDLENYEYSVRSYFGTNDAKSIYVDGSTLLGIDQSGGERKKLGYEYAKQEFEQLVYNVVDESIFLVSHSEGCAFASGIAKYLVEKGIHIKESIMLSADEGDEFSVEGNYPCYQITAGYLSESTFSNKKYFNVDPVVGDHRVEGVDKYGVFIANAEFATVHGITISASTFSLIKKLKKTNTQQAWNSKGKIVHISNPSDGDWYKINDKILYNKRIDFYPNKNNNMITQTYIKRID